MASEPTNAIPKASDNGNDTDDSPKSSTASVLWDKVRKGYQHGLCEFGNLPEYLRDNEYIHRYYRADWPLKQTILSIFKIHNETGNIWTHLIGFFLFFGLTIYTAFKIPTVVELPNFPHLPNFSQLNLSNLPHLPHLNLPHLNLSTLNLSNFNLSTLNLSNLTHFPYLNLSHLPHFPHLNLSHFPQLPNFNLSTFDLSNFPHLSDLPHLQQIVAHLYKLYAAMDIPDMAAAINQLNIPDSIYSTLRLVHSPDMNTSMCYSVEEESRMSCLLGRRQPITRWPLFLFLSGAMFCLLSSTTCHLLSCHSASLSTFLWRLDYAGIAVMITTSFFPPVYYSFMCEPIARDAYLIGITILGFLSFTFSLLPVFQTPKYRKFRAGMFFGMGFSGIFPLFHKLIFYHHEPTVFTTSMYEIAVGLLYGLGAFFYASRIPERWLPGKFDIAGHSHQIFHILVVAGAFVHYHAGLLYLDWRDLQGC